MTSPSGSKRPLLAVLFTTVFLDMVGYGIVVPLLPFFAERYGAGAVFVGLLASLYALMQMFGGPLLGGVSDRIGRRPVILTCLMIACGAYLLLAVSSSLAGICVAVAIAGIAGATPATAQAYIADITLPDERARGLGILGAAFGLGLMAGPVIGGVLSLVSLSAPAIFASLLALSNFCIGFFVLKESRKSSDRERVSAGSASPASWVADVGGILRVSGIRPLLACVFLMNLAFAGLITNFPLFGEARFGWGPSQNAFFFAFVGICAVATQGLLIGALQKVVGETRMLVSGLGIAGVGLFAVALTPAGWLLFPVVGAVAVGFGLAIPSVTSLVSQQISGEKQGGLMGGQQAILSSTLVIGPPVAGLAFEEIGAGAPYVLGATLTLAAFAVIVRYSRREMYH